MSVWGLGLIFLPHVLDDFTVINLEVTLVVWPMLSLKIGLRRCRIDVILCSFSGSAVVAGVSIARLILLIILGWSSVVRTPFVGVTGLILVHSIRVVVSRSLGVTSL